MASSALHAVRARYGGTERTLDGANGDFFINATSAAHGSIGLMRRKSGAYPEAAK